MPSHVSVPGLLAIVGGLIVIAGIIGVGILPSGSLAPYLATQITAPQGSDTPSPTPPQQGPDDDGMWNGFPPCAGTDPKKPPRPPGPPTVPPPDRPIDIPRISDTPPPEEEEPKEPEEGPDPECRIEARINCLVHDRDGEPKIYTEGDVEVCLPERDGICKAQQGTEYREIKRCGFENNEETANKCKPLPKNEWVADACIGTKWPECGVKQKEVWGDASCTACWAWRPNGDPEPYCHGKNIQKYSFPVDCKPGERPPSQDGLQIERFCTNYDVRQQRCVQTCIVKELDSKKNCEPKDDGTQVGECTFLQPLPEQPEPKPSDLFTQNSPNPSPGDVFALLPVSESSQGSIAKSNNPNAGTCIDSQDAISDTLPLNCNLPMVGAIGTVNKCLAEEEAKCKARSGTFKLLDQADTSLIPPMSELRTSSLCTIKAASRWECVGGQ